MIGQLPAVIASQSARGQYLDGMHLYQYVRSNPISRRDPGGLFSLPEMATSGAIYGALFGSAFGWMRSYANYSDEGSVYKQLVAAGGGSVWGAGIGFGMGLVAGALGGAAGGSAALGWGATGMMFSPAALGLSIAEYENAETYGERLMAKIDIGFAAVGIFASHAAVFRSNPAGILGGGKGYASVAVLKRDLGPAGPGKAWHHIVEKTASNVTRFGPEAIHNVNNVIRLRHGPGSIHNKISAYYSSKRPFTDGLTIRKWLSTKSFDKQYQFGIKVLKKYGGDPSKIGR